MASTTTKTGTRGGLGRARVAVSGAFAAQGFGYATMVTTLPIAKDRFGLDTTMLSVIVLLVCITAAVGSLGAGAVAAGRGSRVALVLGLGLQAVSLVVVAAVPDFVVAIAAYALYGVGLGAVDAASGIQGVLVQNRLGRTIMASFFAAYTGAAIVASLIVAAVSALPGGGFAVAFAVAIVILLASAAAGVRLFYVENRPGHDESGLVAAAETAAGGLGPNDAALLTQARPRASGRPRGGPLSVRRAVWVFGFGILFVFVADSAVSTWSSEYLAHTLLTSGAVAPLAYSAYQVIILITRLGGDRAVRRFGRGRVVVAVTLIGVVGFVVVMAGAGVAWAIVGFALVGVATGILVPATFSAAGEVDPDQNDRIISSMNTFNYVGAVLGGAAIGVIADAGAGMALAFALPAVLLLPFLWLVRYYDVRRV